MDDRWCFDQYICCYLIRRTQLDLVTNYCLFTRTHTELQSLSPFQIARKHSSPPAGILVSQSSPNFRRSVIEIESKCVLIIYRYIIYMFAHLLKVHTFPHPCKLRTSIEFVPKRAHSC